MLFVVHQLPVTPIKPPICSATASCYNAFQSDKVSGGGKHDLFVLAKSKSKIKLLFKSIFSVKCFFIEPFEGKQLVLCLELEEYISIQEVQKAIPKTFIFTLGLQQYKLQPKISLIVTIVCRSVYNGFQFTRRFQSAKFWPLVDYLPLAAA